MSRKDNKPPPPVGKVKTEALTNLAQAFVLEYLKDFDGQRAARTAGYSEKTAKQKACALLKDARIQKSLADFRAERKIETVLTFDDRARILSEIARAKISDFIRVSGPGLVAINATENQVNQAALVKLKQKVLSEAQGGGRVTDIELDNRIQAIRELNEMFGDHAPKKVDARISGAIESMTDEELKEEIDRLDQTEAGLKAGRKKAGNGETGKD
jgi:phage terminase small subunit